MFTLILAIIIKNIIIATIIKKHKDINFYSEFNKKEDVSEQIRMIMTYDLVKCFIEMGNSIDLTSRKGIGLFIFMERIAGIEIKTQYACIDEISKERIVQIENNVTQIKDNITSYQPSPDRFIMYAYLKKFNDDYYAIQYLEYLYQFAYITVNEDLRENPYAKILHQQEADYLQMIMNLSDYNIDTTSYFHTSFGALFEEVARHIAKQQMITKTRIEIDFSINDEGAENVMSALECAKIVEPYDNLDFPTYAKVIVEQNKIEEFLLEFRALLKKNAEREKQRQEIIDNGGDIYQLVLLSEAMQELKSLIGLQVVKDEIITFVNFLKIQKQREEKGLKSSQLSYHCVFTGNPGTGKTTVARIVAEIYKELGILQKGHLVETDRSGLVAEYVGQTAVKTNNIIDSALDGVLFIDEAYSLVGGGENDYGKEAIATLLKRMEDNRDRLVVILAGYTTEMQEFINSNSGLQSRFNRYIDFPDYSAEELHQIFEFNLKKFDYTISEKATEKLKAYFERIVNGKDINFGNARFVRNFFEKTLERQANRLSSENNLTTEKLAEICEEDIAL
jgi:AAA+ superfamily predicted ATPase